MAFALAEVPVSGGSTPQWFSAYVSTQGNWVCARLPLVLWYPHLAAGAGEEQVWVQRAGLAGRLVAALATHVRAARQHARAHAAAQEPRLLRLHAARLHALILSRAQAHLCSSFLAFIAGSFMTLLGAFVCGAEQSALTHTPAHLRQLATAQHRPRFSTATAWFVDSGLARRAGSGVAEQRAGVRASSRALARLAARVRAAHAALVLRRAHRPAHAPVLRRDLVVCVLTRWTTPFALH